MISKERTELIRDTIRRYPGMGKLTIAKYLIHHHGYLFNGNLDNARKAIAYHTGSSGEENRKKLGDKIIKHEYTLKLPDSWAVHRDPYILPLGLGLVMADLHIPFHELNPLETAIKHGQKEKVEWILLNGDIWQGQSVTFWPSYPRNFDKEIEAVLDFLDFLKQEFPKAKIIYKPGNHEYRLPRYCMSRCREISQSPLTQLETIMGFEERGIDFLDYYQIAMAGKLPIFHGHELPRLSLTVNPARGLFLKTNSYALCAHCHASSMNPGSNINDDLLTTWSIGCLCELHPEFNCFGNRWNWGFCMINVHKDGNFDVQNLRIAKNGKEVYS